MRKFSFGDANRTRIVRLFPWLRDKGALDVAPYARSYAWDDERVTRFVDMLLSNDADDVGLVLLEGEEKIADGVQRLVIASLMLELSEPIDSGARAAFLLACARRDLTAALRIERARRLLSLRLHEALPQKLDDVLCAFLMVDESFPPDPVVRAAFEDRHASGQRLNGGQILKARHLGAIRSRSARLLVEQWWREAPEKSRADDNFAFSSLDAFVDDRDGRAWYYLGSGFVQSIQAVLLKQDCWWRALEANYGDVEPLVRIDRFDRLNGMAPSPLVVALRTLRPWRPFSAQLPMHFTYGMGFFLLVEFFRRIHKETADALRTLLKMPVEATDADFECLIARFDARETDRSESPWLRPPRILVRCALLLALAHRRIEAEKSKRSSPRFWLGLDEVDEAGRITNIRGSISREMIAVLLLWCERFDQVASIDDLEMATIAVLYRTADAGQYSSTIKRTNSRELIDIARFAKDSATLLRSVCSSSARLCGTTFKPLLDLDEVDAGLLGPVRATAENVLRFVATEKENA